MARHHRTRQLLQRAASSLILTHLLPADSTDRDRVLGRWYAEYLFLNLVAAAHARRFASHPSPPILLLLDELRAWWQGPLRPDHLHILGATGICCAATDTHLPVAPDGDQVLQDFNTWWLHTLAPNDQALVSPYLAAIQPNAGDMPLAHFPPELALLRTMFPVQQVATVSMPNAVDHVTPRAAVIRRLETPAPVVALTRSGYSRRTRFGILWIKSCRG